MEREGQVIKTEDKTEEQAIKVGGADGQVMKAERQIIETVKQVSETVGSSHENRGQVMEIEL